MASSKEFRDFVLEQLRELENITCKPMMGEFLLYYGGKLFGGIYDDRFLIKMTKSNEKYRLPKEIPYKGAKPMYMVENLDDIAYLSELVRETCRSFRPRKKTYF